MSWFWIVLAAGILLSVALFFTARDWEREIARGDFERRAEARFNLLSTRIQASVEVINTFGVLLQDPEQVTREEFSRVAKEVISRHPEIRAAEWAPRVAADKRADYERRARADGLTNFIFKDQESLGRYVPAGAREEYYPVYYIEPQPLFQSRLGLDIGAGALQKTLARARDGGRVRASARTDIVRGTTREAATTLLMPLYRGTKAPTTIKGRQNEIYGVVMLLFPVEQLVLQSWKSVTMTRVDMMFVDGTQGATNAYSFLQLSPQRSGPEPPRELAGFTNGMCLERHLSFAGRDWAFYFRPTPDWLAEQTSWQSLALLFIGLAATGLAGLTILSVRRHARDVESQVAERTSSLTLANMLLQQEITERQRAESQLVKTQQNFVEVQRVAHVGSWESDLVTGIIFWSEECYRIYAQDPGAFKPTREALYMKLIHSADRAKTEEAVRRAIAGGVPYQVEHRILRPDGSTRTLWENGGVVRDEAGKAVRLVGTVSDITERVRLEEQVRQAQKMETVGQLAGGVAHDFNNLLQAMQGFASLARERTITADERDGYLEEVLKAAERAAQLTRQLLAFGRRQTLQAVDTDLNELVKQNLRMVTRLIGEHIKVDFVPGHHLENVRCDRSQVEQVLLNLSVNARDAMTKGGRLTIELENIFINGAYRETHPWARPGRYVMLTVSDTGCGMEKAVVERIFEPFFTTKEHGTGLGLAVVYGIVKQHEGMIHVYSEPGLGTTFKVYLPVTERSASEVGKKLAAVPSGGPETILVVEDDETVRGVARKILEHAGYQVRLARDGREGVRMFGAEPERIALVLMDVVMPGMGGREAGEEIAKLKPEVPIVFCSGYGGGVNPAFALPEGVNLLPKPYSSDELLARVRAALEKNKPETKS